MATQEKGRTRDRQSKNGRNGNGSHDRRKGIIALLLITGAILLLIALLSYDATDQSLGIQSSDLMSSFHPQSDATGKADRVHNALGLAGAMLSDFLINATVGYAVIVLPVLMMVWGWSLFRHRGHGAAIQISNYLLAGAVLVASLLGMIRLIFPASGPGMEWSGVVGGYIAAFLSRLIGRAGGSIVLAVALVITLVLAVDLDIHRTVDRLRAIGLHVMDWLARVRGEWSERRAVRKQEEEAEREQEGREWAKQKAPVSIKRPPVEEPATAGVATDAVSAAKGKAALEEDEHPHASQEKPAKRFAIQVSKSVGSAEAEPSFTGKPVAGTEDIDYVFPSVELLDAPRPGKENIDENELKANADLLRETLQEFDVEVDVTSVTPGPVITLYELVPASGVKISRIVNLENDIALKLAAKGIRIIAPIPGKSAVGVEIPNSHRAVVSVRSVINSSGYRDSHAALPLAMGKTVAGEVFTDDLAKMPHLLIAGSTGSGKSVGINTILASLLYRMHPSMLKLVLVDPKKIELAQYKALKNHFLALSPDVDEEIITTPSNAVAMLRGVEIEMERRYERLAGAGVRNIADYNERLAEGRLKNSDTVVHSRMPYLVVVIDELADLMITAAREVEEPIARLAQLARAVGIHLILATQRPSVDVITGVIKANFPARVAYQVASKTDSRTILDMNGAEQLLGNGDMLYLAASSPKPVRLQNSYISPDEVEAVVGHIGAQQGYAQPFMLPSVAERKRAGSEGGDGERDDLFADAARIIVRHQQGSVSLLQRRLKVGYSRAARLVDELEAAGIVGPYDGSKAREVLVETEEELEMILNG